MKASAINVKPDVNGKEEKQEQDAHASVVIRPLRQKTVHLQIKGMSPYMQARFSQKAKAQMMGIQQHSIKRGAKKARDARDYDEDMRQAMYRLPDGSHGFPAATIRNACISACRTVNFKMTLAKLSIFSEADGLDVQDGTPLIRLNGTPERSVMHARNSNGSVDLRVRPLWREWSANVRIRFDQDQFSTDDIVNLLVRVGSQVGIGEGRPDSRMSAGLGYGLFEVIFENVEGK